MNRTALRWILLVCCALVPAGMTAHELGESSATLTVRDAGVVELRLAVPYDEVLRRTTMPNQPRPIFVAAFSSATDASVSSTLTALHDRLRRGTHIVADGHEVPLTAWQWPDTGAVRTQFRRAAMMTTVGAHEHMERLTVLARGQVTGGASIRQVQVQVPELLGPALVTVLHPDERWLKGGVLSAPIVIR